jgi:hypothetical protein
MNVIPLTVTLMYTKLCQILLVLYCMQIQATRFEKRKGKGNLLEKVLKKHCRNRLLEYEMEKNAIIISLL